MDIVLYKLEVIKGKESIAEEWLRFLKDNEKEGSLILEKEKAYLESYFKEMVKDQMYIYLFFMCDDVEFANDTAFKSSRELDMKHFDYMKKCVHLDRGNIMQSQVFLNNIKDLK